MKLLFKTLTLLLTPNRSQARRGINMSTNTIVKARYLSQNEAVDLDKELFEEYAFSVDQLMELAGLSVAQAVAKIYPCDKHKQPIVCCGPGNNGGDGLVAARHLKLFGYQPIVICPKPGKGQLYQNLIKQCLRFDIKVLEQVPADGGDLKQLGQLIIDSIFGFSFKPPNRNVDFANLLNAMYQTQLPIVSVDIPSGWHVEDGYQNIESDHKMVDENMKIPALKPNCLISLTAPKLCARFFEGDYHFLGGRFCPDSIQSKYNLNLPSYPNTEGVVQLV